MTEPSACSLNSTLKPSDLSVVAIEIVSNKSGESAIQNWKPATEDWLSAFTSTTTWPPDSTTGELKPTTEKSPGSITLPHSISVGLDSPSS